MPFDWEAYTAKCSQMTVDQLHKEWENYTRQISGAATGTAISSAAVPFTAGISLIGVGLSAPRIHNARKKREIIERFLNAQGTTHNTRKRDVLAPMAISGVIGSLTLGLAAPGADILAEAGAAHGVEILVASEVGTKVASHAALEGAGLAVEHAHTKHDAKKGKNQLSSQQELSQVQMAEKAFQAQYYANQQAQYAQGQYPQEQAQVYQGQYSQEQAQAYQGMPPPYTPQANLQQPGQYYPPPASAPAMAHSYSTPVASYNLPQFAPQNNPPQSSAMPPPVPQAQFTRPYATPMQPPGPDPAHLPPSIMPGALPHSYSMPGYISGHGQEQPHTPYTPVSPVRKPSPIMEGLTKSFTGLSAVSHETAEMPHGIYEMESTPASTAFVPQSVVEMAATPVSSPMTTFPQGISEMDATPMSHVEKPPVAQTPQTWPDDKKSQSFEHRPSISSPPPPPFQQYPSEKQQLANIELKVAPAPPATVPTPEYTPQRANSISKYPQSNSNQYVPPPTPQLNQYQQQYQTPHQQPYQQQQNLNQNQYHQQQQQQHFTPPPVQQYTPPPTHQQYPSPASQTPTSSYGHQSAPPPLPYNPNPASPVPMQQQQPQPQQHYSQAPPPPVQQQQQYYTQTPPPSQQFAPPARHPTLSEKLALAQALAAQPQAPQPQYPPPPGAYGYPQHQGGMPYQQPPMPGQNVQMGQGYNY